MPKSPILSRQVFFSPVRGTQNDYLGLQQHRELEWNAVETEIGTMVESKSIVQGFGGVESKITQIDITDNSVSQFTRINEDVFQNQYGTGGASLADFNV